VVDIVHLAKGAEEFVQVAQRVLERQGDTEERIKKGLELARSAVGKAPSPRCRT
jgi:hypothetical protein